MSLKNRKGTVVQPPRNPQRRQHPNEQHLNSEYQDVGVIKKPTKLESAPEPTQDDAALAALSSLPESLKAQLKVLSGNSSKEAKLAFAGSMLSNMPPEMAAQVMALLPSEISDTIKASEFYTTKEETSMNNEESKPVVIPTETTTPAEVIKPQTSRRVGTSRKLDAVPIKHGEPEQAVIVGTKTTDEELHDQISNVLSEGIETTSALNVLAEHLVPDVSAFGNDGVSTKVIVERDPVLRTHADDFSDDELNTKVADDVKPAIVTTIQQVPPRGRMIPETRRPTVVNQSVPVVKAEPEIVEIPEGYVDTGERFERKVNVGVDFLGISATLTMTKPKPNTSLLVFEGQVELADAEGIQFWRPKFNRQPAIDDVVPAHYVPAIIQAVQFRNSGMFEPVYMIALSCQCGDLEDPNVEVVSGEDGTVITFKEAA